MPRPTVISKWDPTISETVWRQRRRDAHIRHFKQLARQRKADAKAQIAAARRQIKAAEAELHTKAHREAQVAMSACNQRTRSRAITIAMLYQATLKSKYHRRTTWKTTVPVTGQPIVVRQFVHAVALAEEFELTNEELIQAVSSRTFPGNQPMMKPSSFETEFGRDVITDYCNETRGDRQRQKNRQALDAQLAAAKAAPPEVRYKFHVFQATQHLKRVNYDREREGKKPLTLRKMFSRDPSQWLRQTVGSMKHMGVWDVVKDRWAEYKP